MTTPGYLFNYGDHARLAGLFLGHVPGHQPDGQPMELAQYSGFRPNVTEIASDTDRTPDDLKRYLHVAIKYLDKHPGLVWPGIYLARAHFEACRVARKLGVPAMYMPDVENATLRVLEYPPGAGTLEHVDFNLFTIVCYRSEPAGLQRAGGTRLDELDAYSPGLHIGELGEMVGLGPATRHSVPPVEDAQESIVYFASPRMDAPLPSGPITFPAIKGHPAKTVTTCGEWQIERVERSRVYA